ncbi:MAG: hydantoinase/oxoprolinase family protein [Proteobacteria bacterium]|nr:hydantoinase/oxoprolinase family protein [Pseudomonadota bacterium]
MILVGVDTGGTFTDLVMMDEAGRVGVHKLPSTPDDPARAVLDGLAALAGADEPKPHVVHGSTVATNAVLTRTGARTALLTTAGFEDVLEIGRQTRPELYALAGRRLPPLVPSERRFGLRERVLRDGRVEAPLDDDDVEAVIEAVRASGAESLAVCLLHAYANPVHEQRVGEQAGRLGLPVSVSHRVLNEFREYERTSTTVVNAFVAPLMARYLAALEDRVGPARLRIMQSNGGSISAAAAREHPVSTMLSGPAGGVCGAAALARTMGLSRVITFDMGGTSTDVSLYDGDVQLTTESVIAGCPIKAPMIRIHTVGAGGGSLARVDAGGALVVGPESAGADPGPACYGRGTGLTVTDANLFLGRLNPDRFLGGNMRLLPERVRQPLAELADRAGLSMERTAEGVIHVVNAHMAKAVRVISVERGYDPRDFVLMTFGGAGGLHACELARALGLPRVVAPVNPGLLSAMGMLLSDVILDRSRTVLLPSARADLDVLERSFRPLEDEGRAVMAQEGFDPADLAAERFLDMRYQGQSFEITVPLTGEFPAAFHEHHQRIYGTMNPDRPTEIVNLRLRLTGVRPKPEPARVEPAGAPVQSAVIGRRSMRLDGRWVEAPLVDRSRLEPGHHLAGPALIVEYSSTTCLPEDFGLEVDPWLNLVIQPKRTA